MKKSKPAKKKPRRVVLGVGHPWFFAGVTIAGRDQAIGMYLMPGHHVFSDLKAIDPKGLGNWNKIRLVAEVLK